MRTGLEVLGGAVREGVEVSSEPQGRPWSLGESHGAPRSMGGGRVPDAPLDCMSPPLYLTPSVFAFAVRLELGPLTWRSPPCPRGVNVPETACARWYLGSLGPRPP